MSPAADFRPRPAVVLRVSELLDSSLRHHEQEVHASAATIHSLRDQLATVETMLHDREEDSKFAAAQVSLVSDEDAANGDDRAIDQFISRPVDTPSSSLIPALSSTSGPLHLRRSSFHSMLVHRSIVSRRLARLESELHTERTHNTMLIKEIQQQEERLEEIRQQVRAMERERQIDEDADKWNEHQAMIRAEERATEVSTIDKRSYSKPRLHQRCALLAKGLTSICHVL